jgi:ABC-type phosphate/phosphonate transport system substrate-binding protein
MLSCDDHIGGEREAARALVAGDADAACMLAANHLVFTRDGTLPARSTNVLAETVPFDHCNMTVNESVARPDAIGRFTELLFSMDYADGRIRPLLDLEGLKRWLPGRVEHYDALARAVDDAHFWDSNGRVAAADRRP